jgi:hypothetical protein
MCDDWLASALEYCCVSTIQTSTKFNGITAEILARNWNIPLKRAKRTLMATTQRGINSRPTIMTQRFKFKSRMVAGGHMVEAPPFLTYASVVSRDTVRIALLMAALHDLDVKAADVENAYLTAPISEKV